MIVIEIGGKLTNYQGKRVTIDEVQSVPSGLFVHGTFDEWRWAGSSYEFAAILVETSPPSHLISPFHGDLVLSWVDIEGLPRLAAIGGPRPSLTETFSSVAYDDMIQAIQGRS